MGEQDIIGENVPLPDKGITFLLDPTLQTQIQEINPTEVWDEPEYYNLNPWARILDRADESDVEIDGIISKALIDNVS